MVDDPFDLAPPLPPALRAVIWLAAACALGAVLVATSPRPPLSGAGAAELAAGAAAALTAVTAALAAFQAGRAWLLMTAPPLFAWIGATALGGLWARGDAWGASFAEASQCLGFLCGVSLPLAVLVMAMLASYRPPPRALMLGGLAAAAAAAGLLDLVHPHPSALPDLGAHLFAAALAVALCAQAGSWMRMRGAAGTASSSK